MNYRRRIVTVIVDKHAAYEASFFSSVRAVMSKHPIRHAFLFVCPEGALGCSHGWSVAEPVDRDIPLSLALKGRKIPLPLQGSCVGGLFHGLREAIYPWLHPVTATRPENQNHFPIIFSDDCFTSVIS